MAITISRPSIPVPLPLTRGGTEGTTPAEARTKLELGDLAQLTAPGGTTTFLRADKTWAVPPGGGGGLTVEDVQDTVGAMATDSATIDCTYDDTAGTLSAAVRTQMSLISDMSGLLLAGDSAAPGNAMLYGTNASGVKGWYVQPAGGGGYTDEQAQDAVGAMLVDTATIGFTYTDATPALTADVKDASIVEAKLGFSDVTTKDASTTAHGLLRKLSGVATEYINGVGAWSTPAGGGDPLWSRSTLTVNTLTNGLLAFWKLEEASGNRVDSVGSLALVPTGATATLTNGAGKVGNALYHGGGSGYLSLADNPTISVGANTSFTIGCWVYFTVLSATDIGILGKGNGGDNSLEYALMRMASGNTLSFYVAGGSSFVRLNWSASPVINTWYFLVAWYDHVADMQYLQVNNGTPVSVANAVGSFDNAQGLEVGRYPGFNGNWFAGRIDNIMLYKRVLTDTERTAWYNSGNGLDYPPTAGTPIGMLTPTTPTDMLVLGTSADTPLGLANGTLRWSGTDFEGRKAGAWVSMTAGAGGQPGDATLTALAGLATGADQLPYSTGTDTFAQTPLTAFARTLLDDTTQAAMRTTLGLTPGTDVQAQDAELQALAGLTSAADRLPYFTGLGTATLATFTAAGRTLAGAADAAAQRTALGLGTLAQQDATNVAITDGRISLGGHAPTGVLDVQGSVDSGGNVYFGARVWPVAPPGALAIVGVRVETATGSGMSTANAYGLTVEEQSGTFATVRGLYSAISAGANKYNLYMAGTAQNYFAGNVGFGNTAPSYPLDVTGNVRVMGGLYVNTTPMGAGIGILHNKAGAQHGLVIAPGAGQGDSGAYEVIFNNAAAVLVGAIQTTATATTYGTSSDVRLKRNIAPLTGALDVIAALNPVSFRWNADDSVGHGFLAHELQQTIPDAVSGLPDEVNLDGSVKPQQVDHSRLVVWLVRAVQELAARLDAAGV